MEHTATPWHVMEFGGWFSIYDGSRDVLRSDECPEAEANANFIVQAVNSHDVLLEALEDVIHHSIEFGGLHNDTQLKVVAAIKKVEEFRKQLNRGFSYSRLKTL